MDKILLIIAARGGSKGVPGKNIRELAGKPLIAYSILQAKRWGQASHIICSTDSDKIAKVALQYGAEVPFMRPAELANDKTGKLEVIRHALRTMEEKTGEKYPIVIDLDATSPVRKIADIEGALKLFSEQRPKTVFSVVPARKNPYFNMVETNAQGYVELVKQSGKSVLRRQDAAKVYDMNASIYVYDRDYLIDENNKSAISDRSLAWVMADDASLDIDSEQDFQFIDYLAKEGLITL
jgi:CMP-N-acetylneuraminic acid synthetase